MVKSEIDAATLSSAKNIGEKSGTRSAATRALAPAVILGLLSAIGIISWIMLYLTNVNVGD
jgi:hypothetical protein